MIGSMVPARFPYELLPTWAPWVLRLAIIPTLVVFAWGCIRVLRVIPVRELWLNAGGTGWQKTIRLLASPFSSRMLSSPAGWRHSLSLAALLLLAAGTGTIFLDDYIARPFGARLLIGTPYVAFMAIVNLAGLAVLVAAAIGLTRYVRSVRKSNRTRQELAVAMGVLLFLAVSGFFLEGLKLTASPSPWGGWRFGGYLLAPLLESALGSSTRVTLYQVLWFTHAFAALGLIAALPHTALAHSVAGPLRRLASSGQAPAALSTPFNLQELMERGAFDVKVGIGSAGDLTAEMRAGLMACVSCGRCDDACPSTLTGGALRPSDLVQDLRASLISPSIDGSLSPNGGSSFVWDCVTCGACVEACPMHVSPLELVVELRRNLMGGPNPDARHQAILAALDRCGNPYGGAPGDRAALVYEAGIVAQIPEAHYVYWQGCAAAYDPRVKRVALSMARLLDHAGIRWAALGPEEFCCGDVARRVGDEGRFQLAAMRNMETFDRLGVKRIITHCAHCFNTLRNEYPHFGARFEVFHHTQIIHRLQAEGKLPSAKLPDLPVALHDSCYVGRYNGLWEEPRRALELSCGAPLRELKNSRDRSLCCGGGGGGYWGPAKGDCSAAAIRVRDAVRSGAGILAVECPFCLKMLESTAASLDAEIRPRVMDVAEIAAAALEQATEKEEITCG